MIHCPHLPTDSPLLLITSIRRIVRTMLLNIVIFIFFLTSLHVEANENICNFPLISCKCFNHSEEIVSPAFVGVRYGLRVECVNMTGVTLHRDIETIKERSKEKIYVLHVRDSNLAKLRGLPSGLVDLKHLTLDNTNIDLEQIRESSEILINLKSLRVFSETFTEIPEDFFSDLHGLNVLSLNNVSMRALSSDGLEFLEDSLKELSLTANKLRSIPPAVVRLPLLEVLDLSDNHIYTIPDDTASIMESGLRSLSRLDLNTINCTCSFGSSEFAEWIRSHAINGVTCSRPAQLKGRDVSTMPTEDFCEPVSSSRSSHSNRIPLVTIALFCVHLLCASLLTS